MTIEPSMQRSTNLGRVVSGGRRKGTGWESETKYFDITNQTVSPVTTAGAITCLNVIAGGSDFNQRIGRQMLLKKLLFRGEVSYTAATSSNGTATRVILLYDRQSDSATPAVTDVLVTADILSFPNTNNRDRFQILYDSVIEMRTATFSGSALVNGSPVPAFIKKEFLLNHDCVYGSASAVNPVTGGLFILYLADTASTVQLSYNSRVEFVDP